MQSIKKRPKNTFCNLSSSGSRLCNTQKRKHKEQAWYLDKDRSLNPERDREIDMDLERR